MDIVQEIESGKYDDRLQEIRTAVLRRSTAAMVQKAEAKSELAVGDRIRLRSNIRPKYLIGMYGEITKLNGKTAVLHIDDARARRFAYGPVRCPYRFIEKVNAYLIK